MSVGSIVRKNADLGITAATYKYETKTGIILGRDKLANMIDHKLNEVILCLLLQLPKSTICLITSLSLLAICNQPFISMVSYSNFKIF